jgi:AraC-like DNA-binding protein
MSTHTPEVPPRKRAGKLPGKGLRPAAADPNLQPRKPPVAAGIMRLGIAAEISAVLRQFGADPDEYTKLTQLTSLRGACRGGSAQVLALGQLMALCVARTNCPHFGLLVGQRDILSSLGLVECLMPPSQTVGKALNNLIWHLRQHNLETAPRLTVSGGMATLSCATPDPGMEGVDQIADGAAATALNIMGALCGPEWAPAEVLLPRLPPPDPRPFERLFRTPVRFEAGTAALIFPASWLKRRIAGADEVLHLLFGQRLGTPEARPHDGSFSDGLRRMLRTRLLKDDCSAPKIAGLLSMNRRTLNRRLHAEGTAFNILANEIRFEIARQLLANTTMTFGQIAAALAFSEPSAFTRAFRRWSGQSPTAWQAEHHRVRTRNDLKGDHENALKEIGPSRNLTTNPPSL